MQASATEAMMGALAQPTRLKVVGLLSRAGSVGKGSSEIADEIGIPRNLMSSHLAILTRAGLLSSRRTGRFVVYVLNPPAIRQLSEYLSSLVPPGVIDGLGD